MTKRSKNETIVWVLLAPAAASWLQPKVDAFWKSKMPHPDHSQKWEVHAGSSTYSAVVNRNPGTDETYEIPLARQLSRELPEPVYVLYPQDAYTEVDSIFVYEGGKERGTISDDPYSFAADLGTPLRTKTRPKTKLSTRTVVLVEGVNAADAARALDFESPPGDQSLSIEDGKLGALVHSSTVGDLTTLAYELSRAFRDSTIYVLSSGPAADRLYVQLLRNETTLGVYDSPIPVTITSGGPPQLTSIRGETNREAIIRALGIPLELLKTEDD